MARARGRASKAPRRIAKKRIKNYFFGKKFGIGSSLRCLALTATKMAKLKVKKRVSAMSLAAAKKAARETQAEFELLVATRNELANDFIEEQQQLLDVQALEAALMSELDI